jgi:hypothetical protein
MKFFGPASNHAAIVAPEADQRCARSATCRSGSRPAVACSADRIAAPADFTSRPNTRGAPEDERAVYGIPQEERRPGSRRRERPGPVAG